MSSYKTRLLDIIVENTSGFGLFAFVGDKEVDKEDAA